MRAVIFANGEFHQPEKALGRLKPEDVLIAVDGGARYCQLLGLRPDYAIGDFDSLSQAELDQMSATGVQLVRFPERKDFTDLELALRHALDLGCDTLVVFAALGGRWDQTLANVLLLAAPDFAGISIQLVDGDQDITLLHPGQKNTLTGEPGDTLSLIPLKGNVHGISTQGLDYALHHETLHFGATRGVSNVLTRTQASIAFEKGLLLCTLIHHPAP